MSEHVWYVAYGSNLYLPRFLAYIQGGTLSFLPGRAHAGCADSAPPRAFRALSIPYELYFARHSSAWDGAVAFIGEPLQSKVTCHCRAYLVRADQFVEIWQQENGVEPDAREWRSALSKLRPGESAPIQSPSTGWYQNLIYLRDFYGHPAFSFTSASDLRTSRAAPSATYLRTIAAGLLDRGLLSKAKIVAYLENAIQLTAAWDSSTLLTLVNDCHFPNE